jgi:hyperpolarization activated cyclic nucleotide-gated potassium channel 2
LLWDLFCMVFIFYCMMMIPFRMSFQDESDIWMTFESIDTVIDFIFLIDIVVTFNTAIYHKG